MKYAKNTDDQRTEKQRGKKKKYHITEINPQTKPFNNYSQYVQNTRGKDQEFQS